MKALHIDIRPSVELGVLLCLLYLSAVAMTLWLPLPLWLKGALLIGAGWDLKRNLDKVAFLRGSEAILAVHVTSDGRVRVRPQNGSWVECRLLPASFVTPSLTILTMKVTGRRRLLHAVLCGRNVDTTEFRRLRAWLRWGQHGMRSATGSLNGR